MNLPEFIESLPVELFEHQQRAVVRHFTQHKYEIKPRTCLYYPTGTGKTIASLASMLAIGQKDVLVIAPPSTQADWVEMGGHLGIAVHTMSHAKFRMEATKVQKKQAIICDEFHLLGGRKGKGWKKMLKVSRNLDAPLMILSATPSYNDAERVYCVQKILDPDSLKGGFEKFILNSCTLEPSFRGLPTVTGFLQYDNAEDYLSRLANVYYIPDTAVYEIQDVQFRTPMPPSWISLGWDERKDSLNTSLMGRRISYLHHQIKEGITGVGYLRNELVDKLIKISDGTEKNIMVFCEHSAIAEAAYLTLQGVWPMRTLLLTGDTNATSRDILINRFRDPKELFERGQHILVCTAAVATGTDGFDKTCDTLVLLQDTPDDSLRRQIIGRVLPRGLSANYEDKRFYRFDYGKP